MAANAVTTISDQIDALYVKLLKSPANSRARQAIRRRIRMLEKKLMNAMQHHFDSHRVLPKKAAARFLKKARRGLSIDKPPGR